MYIYIYVYEYVKKYIQIHISQKMLAVGDFGNYLHSKNTEPKPRSHVDPSSELNTVERTEVSDKKAAATKKTERNKNYIYPKHN